MLDRSKAPAIVPPGRIEFPSFQSYKVGEIVPIIELDAAHHDVVKIEIVFRSGRASERKRLAAKYTNMLLKTGTASKSSKEINQHIEYYGATISQPVSFDYAGVTLYCLSRFAKHLIPLLVELILAPTFPQDELDFFRQKQKSKLQVALTKVDTVAFRQITENLFGTDHPYGYNSTLDDHDAIQRSDLKAHFEKTYIADNCQVFISGNLTHNARAILEQELKKLPRGHMHTSMPKDVVMDNPREMYMPMSDKVQRAIRIGRPLFNINHVDYIPIYLLHVLLGGYFGSRLSRVIREEKGLTYGIHTILDSMLYGGCLMISTEVDTDTSDEAIEAIYNEIEDFIQNPISHEEMEQMVNYLKGYLLSSINGVFKSANVIKSITMAGGDIGHFDRLQEVMDHITPNEIQTIAQKYLKREDLWQVVAG